MKLLRLKSEINTLQFNGSLDYNLILPPQSKIALKNVAFEKAEVEIVISSTKDILEFTIGTKTYTATLEDGEYSSVNIQDLRVDIKKQMNIQLEMNDGLVIGGRWHIDYHNNVFTFIFSQSPVINIVKNELNGYLNTGVDETDPDSIFKLANTDNLPNACIGVTGTSDNYECFADTKIHNKFGGCGFVRVQINTISDDSNGNLGFFIGMSNKRTNGLSPNFSVERFEYAIYAKNTEEFYQYMDNTNSGSLKVTAISPQNGDVLEMALSGGQMVFTIYRIDGVTSEVIFSGNNTQNDYTLYPYLVFYSQENNKVSNYEFTPYNDVEDALTTDLMEHNTLNYGIAAPPIQELYNREFKIIFYNNLNDMLGFLNDTISYYGTNFEKEADQKVILVDEEETYIVTIQNYSLDSYDLSPNFKSKRNILDVIQNIKDKKQDSVYYNANYPALISLNNKNDILLSNLNLEIVTSDGTRPVINGYSNLSLIIE